MILDGQIKKAFASETSKFKRSFKDYKDMEIEIDTSNSKEIELYIRVAEAQKAYYSQSRLQSYLAIIALLLSIVSLVIKLAWDVDFKAVKTFTIYAFILLALSIVFIILEGCRISKYRAYTYFLEYLNQKQNSKYNT